MKCPCCNGLYVTHYIEGVDVDVCNHCWSMFFEEGELWPLVNSSKGPEFDKSVSKLKKIKQIDLKICKKLYDFINDPFILWKVEKFLILYPIDQENFNNKLTN